MQKLAYIHNNPLETGLIHKPEDWKHSSYNAYYNKKKEQPNLKLELLFNDI